MERRSLQQHDEENHVKRRRQEASTATASTPASRDCFEQVSNSTSPSSPPPILSSWLRHLAWIGMNTPLRAQQRQHNSSEACNRSKSDLLLQEETETLSKQLLQVKRRLGSAAERAAQALSTTTSSHEEFVEARRACNPYEKLGEGREGGLNELFMNRSAIKLANMDALLGFCFTTATVPATVDDDDDADDTFVFVDLCGAPGGFSEYIMRRCIASGIPSCKGYGMSLVGTNEYGRGLSWKLDDFVHSERETDVAYRVCLGEDGTGDIFPWKNIESLQAVITKENPDRNGKVHLVLADGGFDAQRDAEDQEGMTQKLVVCEVAAALALLRQGGMLVVKLFGFQTPVIQSVLRYLFCSFESLIAVKPISSRPASAERYVVCSGFRGCPSGWDGPRWCNQMFLGDFWGNNEEEKSAMPILERYLGEFDRDLLALNLKACYAVLSYLEAKCMREEQVAVGHYYSTMMISVDVEEYKLAWNLL